MKEKKLYVITRRDLPPAVRAVQAIHAATNLAYNLGASKQGEWGPIGPHLILLAVEDRHVLADFAAMKGAMAFHEPDMGDQLTAVALFRDSLYDDRARLL